ncbi:MAG: hypothetical protein WBP81_18880 [Solirubrobacteraceae bacterium]
MRGETVVIERRFRGPLDSGHGGYTCGLLAREIPGAAEGSLLVPPPLERQLTLERVGDGRVMLRDREVIVADARPVPLELDPPAPVALSDAQTASLRAGSRVTRCRCASGAAPSANRGTASGCSRDRSRDET